MRVATAAEMARIDRITIVERRIPGLILMEHAGQAIAGVLATRCPDLARRHVAIVAGGGNNGGDGFVVARLLAMRGCRVDVIALRASAEYRGDALTNLQALAGLPVTVTHATTAGELERARPALASADVVLDAVLGTGARGGLSPLLTAAVEAINRAGGEVLAVDIPTGVDADTGQAPGPAVRAACTVTMGLPKPGFFHPPGSELAGQVYVADLGFPRDLTDDEALKLEVALARELAPLVERRSATSHKGDHGRLLVVGGSAGMTGAAVMSAKSAAHAGCGLVKLLLPASTWPAVAAQAPEILVQPAHQTGSGALGREALAQLPAHAAGVDVVLIGPGIGRGDSTSELVREAIAELDKPLVIDADGLRALDASTRFGVPAVLTPHASEAAHLLGASIDAVNADRFGSARTLAAAHNATVILKGPHSLVAAPGAGTSVNPSGNPGLATAGSGDVLAGTVAGLMALREGARRGGREVPPLARTVSLAVYAHGLAADLAAEAKGTDRLTAPDVMDHLSAALAMLGRVGTGELIASDRIRLV